MTKVLNRTFSVAPMMEWTDTHYRSLARIITKHALLYTEMITTPALYYGNTPHKHLTYTPDEHPIAVQLGGSDIPQMVHATKLCNDYGYDEINLNVGCPSHRVQNGLIGAILMNHPELVADCVRACADNTDIPITVKQRIGLNAYNIRYDVVKKFIDIVASTSPCDTFIVHARIAVLQGLSPKQNRHVPPLHYDFVYRLKQDFPKLNICINGGIQTLAHMHHHLQHIDGVMVGRSAYQTPYDTLAYVDRDLYNDTHPIPTRTEVVMAYCDYIHTQMAKGIALHTCAKHLMGMFHGQKGGKAFRRYLSQHMHKKNASTAVITDALSYV